MAEVSLEEQNSQIAEGAGKVLQKTLYVWQVRVAVRGPQGATGHREGYVVCSDSFDQAGDLALERLPAVSEPHRYEITAVNRIAPVMAIER